MTSPAENININNINYMGKSTKDMTPDELKLHNENRRIKRAEAVKDPSDKIKAQRLEKNKNKREMKNMDKEKW